MMAFVTILFMVDMINIALPDTMRPIYGITKNMTKRLNTGLTAKEIQSEHIGLSHWWNTKPTVKRTCNGAKETSDGELTCASIGPRIEVPYPPALVMIQAFKHKCTIEYEHKVWVGGYAQRNRQEYDEAQVILLPQEDLATSLENPTEPKGSQATPASTPQPQAVPVSNVAAIPDPPRKPDVDVVDLIDSYPFKVEAAHNGWTATGIKLNREHRVTFIASGQITYMARRVNPAGGFISQTITIGPEGAPWTPEPGNQPEQFLLPNTRVAAVIASCGQTVLPVGAKAVLDVSESNCELKLGINERWIEGDWLGNQGAFDVEVQIERQMPAKEYVAKVYANSMWTNTGISIQAGDLLTIHATGQASGESNPNDAAYKVVGPDGWGYDPTWQWTTPAGVRTNWLFVLGKNSSFMCLTGRIGKGQPFKVGSSFQINTNQSGPLLLGINSPISDVTGRIIRNIDDLNVGAWHNQGEYVANIEVLHSH